MATRKPGFHNSSTAANRNRRENRYGRSGANNDNDVRGKDVNADTISFTAPDLINDSGNGLAKFEVGEVIRVEGSAAQDGAYEVATVAAGQIETVEQTITTEGAGADMAVSSNNNRNTNRVVNRAA